MAFEHKNNFVWALEKFKGLFFKVDSYLKVVVSDKDISLMNVINVVFPKVCNLLCHFHIEKNMNTKCKMLVNPRETCDQVMEAWGSTMDYDDVEIFQHCVEAFKVVCSPWPMSMVFG